MLQLISVSFCSCKMCSQRFPGFCNVLDAFASTLDATLLVDTVASPTPNFSAPLPFFTLLPMSAFSWASNIVFDLSSKDGLVRVLTTAALKEEALDFRTPAPFLFNFTFYVSQRDT